MHARTTALLLLFVGALGALAWWQVGRENAGAFDADRPLLEGFERARISALRVDNLERSLQMRLEARPDGTFQIVDPIDFPAEPAVIELVMDLLANQRAIAMPSGDLRKLALDPPRVVLEIEERTDAAARTRRIEIGAVDVDQQHVFARVEGQLVRTERGLDSALERDLVDWRARRVLDFDAPSVVEIHRSGSYLPAGEQAAVDQTLDAVLDGPWRATAPFSAQLQTSAVNLLLAGLVWLQVDSFVDVPGDLAHYGLDQPALRFEMLDAQGSREVLLLAREPGRESWYAAREGAPYVYRVADDSVSGLCVRASEFVERRLFVLQRDLVERVELAADGRRTLLVRAGRGWRLSAFEDERTTIDDEPADGGKVDDLLGALERARFSGLLFERQLDPGAAIGSLYVQLAGERQGGILGAPYRTSDGAEGVPFRRDGDALVAALEPALLELARTDPESLRSLELHKIAEIDVARIEIASPAATRAYHRNSVGRWSRDGSDLEAREFAKLVDRILSMRALALLKRGVDDAQLDAPVTVRITTNNGNERLFTLARRPDPAGGAAHAVYRDDARLARVKPELHGELVALLAAEGQ